MKESSVRKKERAAHKEKPKSLKDKKGGLS